MGCACNCCTCYCCPKVSSENEIHVPFAGESNTGATPVGRVSSVTSSLSNNGIFVPNLIIKKTANGVISLRIANIEDIINAPSPFNNWSLWNFELAYKFNNDSSPSIKPPTNTIMTTSNVTTNNVNQWHYKQFLPEKLNSNGEFFIRNKVHLHDYQMVLRLRAKPAHFSEYYPFCPPITVTILSSLNDSEYAIGEYINFVLKSSMYTKEGIIVRKLDESHYQIQNKQNGQLLRVHSSRVYAAPIFLQFVIDFSDRLDVDSNLLLRNHVDNKQAVDTFNSLQRLYKGYALEYCSDCNFNASSDKLREADAECMGRVVAKYVTDFLFVPYYKEPKIGCLGILSLVI